MTRRLFFAVALLALLVPTPAPAQSASARLTILHTNDTHGHLLPFDYPTIVPAGSDLEQLTERRNIGGIARRAALAQKIRAEQKGRGIPVWFVDIGDFSDGTPFSTEYKGEADVAAMNAAGYDFSTFGNHEFNNPLTHLRKLLRLTKHPVLLANAVDRATKKPLGEAWRIERIGGLRVGLFGLVTRESATYPAAREGVDILDEISTAKSVVQTLRAQADIVVLLSHAGEETDMKIAAEVPGIDVIVGGHSHSRMPIGQLVWRGDDLKQNDVDGTVVVQAFQWGGELGRLDLLFEKDGAGAWRVSRYRARLLPVTADLPAEPMVAAVVDKYLAADRGPLRRSGRPGNRRFQQPGRRRGAVPPRRRRRARDVQGGRRVRKHRGRAGAAGRGQRHARRSRHHGSVRQHGRLVQGERCADQGPARAQRAARVRPPLPAG